jgi:hypothetical protein
LSSPSETYVHLLIASFMITLSLSWWCIIHSKCHFAGSNWNKFNLLLWQYSNTIILGGCKTFLHWTQNFNLE